MTSDKIKVKILEESADKVKIEFPTVKVPVSVSKRYFKKIKNDNRYLFEKSK